VRVSPARAPRPPALRYRQARRTDVETLAELGYRAYRVSSLEKRREFYTDHPRFTIRDVRVGELDGQIVCSLVLYPFTAFVRGQRVPMTGIGSVAVSPEQRRRGIGEALVRATLREMRQQGQAFSILYAFRGSFYRKFGWGAVEITHPIAFSPANLPASEEARRTRRLMLPDRLAVQELYARVAQQGHLALERRPEWWAQRLWTYPGDWVVYEGRRRGQIDGYLYYEADTTNGPFKLALTLSELVAATPDAHRGLVGHLASLADQVSEIHYAAPGDAAWPLVLKTPQNLRPGPEVGLMTDTGNLGHGVMLRVVDVKLALEQWPVAPGERGEVVIAVDDAAIPLNARAYRVSARDGRLKVRPETARVGVRPRLPRVRIPADMLGPVLAGTVSASRAAEVGLIDAKDGADEIIEGWFRTRPAFLYHFNAF
jgi:predicted acetyltransferase